MDAASTDQQPPLVCGLTGAPGAVSERLAEYRRLFAHSLIGRSQAGGGVRFRFRAAPGLAGQLRDLAAREQACCPFFRITVTASGPEIWWDISAGDDEASRQVLAEFARLPDTLPDGDLAAMRGLRDGGLRLARPRSAAGG